MFRFVGIFGREFFFGFVWFDDGDSRGEEIIGILMGFEKEKLGNCRYSDNKWEKFRIGELIDEGFFNNFIKNED